MNRFRRGFSIRLIIVVITLILVATAVGCKDEPEHQHSFSETWSSDETYHWHAATCGHSDVADKAEHEWNEGEVTDPATTTKEGTMTFTCTVCGKTRTEAIPMIICNHLWQIVDAESFNPTHTATGLDTRVCSICGEKKVTELPALVNNHTYEAEWTYDETDHWHEATCGHDVTSGKAPHSWDEGEITTPATHETDGLKTYTCTVCGKTKDEVIPKAEDAHTFSEEWTTDATYHWHAATCGHDVKSSEGYHGWDEGVVTTPATHTTDGLRTYTCEVCGKTWTETIQMAEDTHTFSNDWSTDESKHWHAATCGHEVKSLEGNHSWNEGEVTTPATHTTDGLRTFTCTVCGKTRTEVIPMDASAHTFSETWSKDSDYHWHDATCGHAVIEGKTSHVWNDGVVTTSPTHTTTGTKRYTCTVCGQTKDEVLPALADAHTFSEEWSSDETYHWHESTCGHPVLEGKTTHSWNEGTVTKAATEFEDGIRTFTCTVCGKTRTEVIAHSHVHSYPDYWKYKQVEGSPVKYKACTCGNEVSESASYEDIFDLYEGGLYVKYVDALERYEIITGNWTIPSTLGEEAVTGIEYGAFCDQTELTGIVLPNSVTEIGDYILEGCTSVSSLSIPASVTDISGSLLGGCESPVEVSIASDNPNYKIENGMLLSKDGTTLVSSLNKGGSITIPDGVTEIAFNAFFENPYVTQIITPDSLTTIGSYAFSYSQNLGRLVISSSVENIGEEAFIICSSLEIVVDGSNPKFSSEDGVLYNKEKTVLIAYPSARGAVTIKDGVTEVGRAAFQGCEAITSVTIPETVTRLDHYCFYDCDGLTSVVIPDSVTALGWEAFADCSNLTEITVGINAAPDMCERIFARTPANITFKSGRITIPGNMLSGGNLISAVTIPDTVNTIGDNAFMNCKWIISIVIPDGVTKISANTFSGCTGLESVTIPASVTSIGSNAFKGCEYLHLSGITFGGTKAQWATISKTSGWNAGVDATCKVHCTDGDVLI